MDKITRNKIAMYKAVKDVLANHQAVWSGMPAFANVHGTFINKLTALEASAYNQSLSLVGISAAKDVKREAVVDKTYAISSGMVAYAVLNNNATLLNRMKIAKHELKTASKTALMLLVDRVLAKANEFGNDLSDFGVDQQSIAELQALRDELDSLLHSPRNAIVARKGYTKQILALRRELDVILKLQLDKLMHVLRADHPDFFVAYSDARIIVDHKNSSSNGDKGSSKQFGYEE